MEKNAVLADEFRHAIGHFPTGVAVITTSADGQGHGATVSALSSLSLEPPMLLICLKETSRTLGAVRRTGRFVVNLLTEEQTEVAAHFASSSGAKLEAPADQAMPRIDGALGHIECEVESMVRGGTHQVILAVVTSVEMSAGQRPLTYYRSRFGGFLPALTLVKPAE